MCVPISPEVAHDSPTREHLAADSRVSHLDLSGQLGEDMDLHEATSGGGNWRSCIRSDLDGTGGGAAAAAGACDAAGADVLSSSL